MTGAAKKFWSRPRPYVTSAEVKPVVSNVTEGSYPSGHATCGYLWAILLADMIPERRDELFARGTRYGMNRVVGGVHYPTDAEAGRLSAAVIAAVMFTTPAFRSDFAAARAELRAALGYAAGRPPPDLSLRCRTARALFRPGGRRRRSGAPRTHSAPRRPW